MKKKETISLFFVIVASLVISFVHCPLFDIYFDDKEIFRYTGMAIAKGGIPYKTFFDHKPPLIFFFYVIHYKFGAWIFWLFDTTLVCLTALAFCKLCIRSAMRFPYLLPIVFVLLLRNPMLSFGIGMTRAYTAIFLLLFLIVCFSHNKNKYFIAGILAGLTFFMQQDQIILLLPFGAYFLYKEFRQGIKPAFNYIFLLLVGALVVTVPVIIYFVTNDALSAFWEDAFLFNFNWYSERISLFTNVKLINNLLSASKTDYIFYSTLLLLIISLFSFAKNKLIVLATCATILLSFLSEFISGKLSAGLSLQYYALPIAATIPFGLYILFAKTRFTDKLNEVHMFYYTAIMSVPLVIFLLQFASNTPKQNYGYMKDIPEVQYLTGKILKDHEVFIAFDGNYDFIYNQHKILSPSPWLYLSFWAWYSNWDPKNKKLLQITTDLDKYNTKYILSFADSNKIKNRINYDFWQKYINQKYMPVQLPDSSYSKTLFLRK